MCTVLEVVEINVAFLLELPEQIIINDMHKTNSRFQDKYDNVSFEHATVLTSLVFIKVSKTVYLFIRGTTRIRIRPSTLNPLFRTALI